MTQPYPFYKNPPRSYDDVKEYLTTWLEITLPSVVQYDGASWTQTHGFKRAFNIHGVFQNHNRVAFHVGEDGDMQLFPNFGVYASFDKMIDGVAKRYCALWKIQM